MAVSPCPQQDPHGWSEHSAGLWRVSIVSRFGADRMYTSTSPALGRETPHAGDPTYATSEEGPRHLVNKGFATLPWGVGTRGMVVSQQDGLRQDTRSEEHVTNRRRDGEPPRRAPHTDTAASGAPGHEAVQQGGAERSQRHLRGLLRLGTFAALRYREFRLLWSGQAATAMAMWMDQVVRGWLMYELTNSPVQLGLVHGVQAVPILVLSPIAGSVADRYPRKQQVVVAQVLAGAMYAVLALLIMTGRIRPWHVYATAFGMAIVQTFHQPARAAMVADAVPTCHLTNAIGLTSIMFNLARSTGPALAGFLIATLGTASCYAVQVGFYLLAIVWTLGLRPDPSPATSGRGRAAHEASFGRSIVEGWTFSWRHEAVRAGLLIMMCASLFIVPFTTLLPVFARDLLGVGATGQGGLLTAMGVGALCSAVLLASFGDQLPRGLLMLGGVTLYGLSVVAFAASASFRLSLGLMTVVGLAHVSSHALVQTVVQTYSPSTFRGRTMAIFHMSSVVLTLGSTLAGTLASLMGARWAVASMGATGALLMITIAVALPRARLIR
jgi:MFS family permease